MHSEVVDQIRAAHRSRMYCMEVRKRADLALGSHLRGELGWSRNADDETNSRARDLADKLMDCGRAEMKRLRTIAANQTATKPKVVPTPHALIDTEEWREYGDTILMTFYSYDKIDQREDIVTKRLDELAMQLPVWKSFGEQIRGFSATFLGTIIGEAGDLSNYPDHSKLWKRMGLAPFVKDGLAMSGAGWRKHGGLTKDEWSTFGYSPVKRSRMFVIGDVLLKCNGTGRYRTAYLARKDYEIAKAEAAGLQVLPAGKIPKGRRDEFVSQAQVHARAKYYMEKRLLRDLWQAWRASASMRKSAAEAVPAENSDAPQGAGQAISEVPSSAAFALPDHHSNAPQGAGEAGMCLPMRATTRVPPHLSRCSAELGCDPIPSLQRKRSRDAA
ncbi:hypothetical protein OOZ54_12480 [Rhodopseudomonas palustris]|uniref:hypothetical protein n=1 Tax=Rhodopseudomonas palustris TaxID=1076 RepID=UPI0022F0EE21|nr:hypothetical protein [Rhodopseudomonas palustris]WBU27510.1 hypothetical protein OOZ54_12480 [Rhodopseudomonas palustris]